MHRRLIARPGRLVPVAAGAALAVLAPGSAGAVPQPPAGTTTASSTASVRFLVKGDWGTGSRAQAAITGRMCASHAARPAAFILTTGDNFYSPDGTATPSTFDRPEACLLATGLPWRATWGNHDLGGASTATRLLSPRRWYSFARGPLRVIVLDGNQPASSAQLSFLRSTLVRATEPVRVVSIHQPVYTAGLHAPSTIEQRLMAPLFRRYGVSLVLSGHNHSYERIVTGGVTYIVSGGGGAALYPCVRVPRGLARCRPEHHFLEVDASAASLSVRAVRRDGSTLESIQVPVRTPTAASARTAQRQGVGWR